MIKFINIKISEGFKDLKNNIFTNIGKTTMNFKESILGLMDFKTVAVLGFFIQNPNKEFCLNEITNGSKVPIATTHRIIKKLIKQNLISFNKIKSLRIYKLNESDAISYLNTLFEDSDAHINEFVELIRHDPNIETIMQYGKETKDRVNLLVIGKNVNPEPIKANVYAIKEKYGITINTLVLEQDQYEQMSDMGLYANKKKTLFNK